GRVFSYGNAWSPDGKYIAFGALDLHTPGGEGLCAIAVLDLQTGAVKDLSSERWDTCFRMAWTPNGDGLVFIGTRSGESYTTRRDQVYYLSAADGRSRRISTDGSRYQASSLGITAYNSLLVVPHKKLSQIWAVDADGSTSSAVPLTNGQLDGNAGIAPLPDGRIGYISRVGENLGVWVMNADGSNQQQIGLQLQFVEELRSTPDGRYFIFSARRNGFSHLYRIDIDGENLTQLTYGESHEVSSTISPDSQWVYYGSNLTDGGRGKTIFRKTSVDGSQTLDIKAMETTGLIPSLSSDGKHIAGVTTGGLKILSASDGSLVQSLIP
ncbi:MAG TPA: DPP IV N-terminal domain-containing protein, partial [Pyrinomonadaceae bacterium]|nr:DPP IV N-terminal domain-containing protein [Pyrinomonadaceae bacterium]